MLENIMLYIGVIAAVTILGLVIGILFTLYGVIHLKLKQLSLRIEADPLGNPFKDDKAVDNEI